MLTGNDALRIRIKLVAAVFILIFAGLWGRLYYVQIMRHKELYGKARRQYTAVRTTVSKRGEIFDINGNLLVGNIPCDDIIADPGITSKNLSKCRQLAKLLACYLKLDYNKVLKKLTHNTRIVSDENGVKTTAPLHYAMIARQVPLDTTQELKKIISPTNRGKKRNAGFSGIFFKESCKRYYPKGELLANILGFTNVEEDEVIPVIGIERSLNRKISSSKGKVRFERSRDGRILTYSEKQAEEAHDGWNVYLTIDEPIQAIVEEELEKLCEKWKPQAAYAVMADPYTGNILAVAQRPSFDPNDRSRMTPDAWRVRVSADTFEPGSAMKPIAISGAIDNGIVTPETIWSS
ncbi:MAG: penicillin-binding transpeptidase domain-containing protein [Victivallaceae bacterium]|nr:penicillin-binding transpeptidase domain-containing protein [Victivallaceae bacterium]